MKHTILKANGLCKSFAHNGGQVLYKDKDLVTVSEKELATLRHTDFGFIFQQMHLVSNLTLFENVVVPLPGP